MASEPWIKEAPDMYTPDWLEQLDKYFGRDTKAKDTHIGRPFKVMNEDLICHYKNIEGRSNRWIARELGYSRRTLDYRVNKLRNEGKIYD